MKKIILIVSLLIFTYVCVSWLKATHLEATSVGVIKRDIEMDYMTLENFLGNFNFIQSGIRIEYKSQSLRKINPFTEKRKIHFSSSKVTVEEILYLLHDHYHINIKLSFKKILLDDEK